MQTPEFHIEIRDDGPLLVLTPCGELDLASVPEVERALAAHAAGRPALVVDLSRLTFMDSTGIRMLVELWQRRDGTAMAFVAPAEPVGRVLDVTGVRSLLAWVEEPADVLGDDRVG